MYRHLLVPLDDTDLSIETVGRAVEFARTLGARITFFHAQADYSAAISGDAEVLRLTSPADYSYAYEGRARELLTKAESAARACGVPCSSLSIIDDTPYRAILAAARSTHCDLVFMASHGRRSQLGMMLGSQTLKVVTHSEIPVLVSATAEPSRAVQAIGIIRDEHRSMAAVLHAWLHLLKRARVDGTQPDLGVMQAIVRYIRDFPQGLHHPKEQDYLFRKLRERTVSANAELDELERQHLRDHQLFNALAHLVEEYAHGTAPLDEVEQAVANYARFMWEHMGREEGVILPAAQRFLKDEDWVEINAAFSGNDDPRFGGDTDAEYKRLFSRIVNLAHSPAEETPEH
ncbi:MAG: universal stress protein [Proteobacteria bacterium]|nr:universal stress protein [Pseudomonadota bacterium]